MSGIQSASKIERLSGQHPLHLRAKAFNREGREGCAKFAKQPAAAERKRATDEPFL